MTEGIDKMEIKQLLNKILDKKDLTIKEASALLERIIQGELNPTQVAAVLVGLRTKGESVEEIIGFIQTMRKYMSKVATDGQAMDIVGTGGDGSGTFNISTTSSFIVAGCGIKVAKHGNRAASSKCGSADVLESLGVNINLTPEQAGKVLQRVGMVFLFAPLYHPAMKNIGPVRKELGIRTIFNFLGPFLNPAQTKRQLLGVPSKIIAKKLAQVATKLQYKHLMLVISEDGMDEITTTGKTSVFDIKGTKIKTFSISPKEYGIRLTTKNNLLGKDVLDNANIIKDILKGEKNPKRDIVVLNSAAALIVAGKVKTIKQGMKMAQQAIDSGAALKVLENLIRETQKYA